MGFETGAGEFMQAGSYSAAQLRRSVFAWAARTSANTPGLISGGLLSASDMQLSAASSGLVVYTSVGECLIPGTEATSQGGYHGFLSSQNSTTLATANPTNPRIDLLCATSADGQYTIPSGGTSGFVTIQAVTGTPTAGATLSNLSGVGTLPGSSLLLGYVLVPAGATSLTNADILNVALDVPALSGLRKIAFGLNNVVFSGSSQWSATTSVAHGMDVVPQTVVASVSDNVEPAFAGVVGPSETDVGIWAYTPTTTLSSGTTRGVYWVAFF